METNVYPDRVTRCADGVYRWSYVLSREQSRYYFRLMMKICVIAAAAITVILLAMCVLESWHLDFVLRTEPERAGEYLLQYLHRDADSLLIIALLPGAVTVGLPALLGLFLMNGGERYRFEMDEEAVRHKNASRGGDVTIAFDEIQDITADGEMLLLKRGFTTYRIYVPQADIAFVEQFMRERS